MKRRPGVHNRGLMEGGAVALDVEKLLNPVSEESPAGEDLAYDPERAEIEQVFEQSVSVDATGRSEGESDIDWRRIVGLLESQAGRTKDIWLAVYLCRAGARSGSLETLEVGAEFLAGLCEQYWETMHPSLEDYGFQGRKGPCESLANVQAFLGPLRRVVLLSHPRLGSYTGADFERFRANAESEEGYGMFRAAVAEMSNDDIVAIGARLATVEAALKRTDAALDANAGGETGANFAATYATLNELRRAVLSFGASPEPEGETAEAEADPSGDTGDGPRVPGRIDSREQVIRALEAIADYYRRREPGSPVPVALQRVRGWIDAEFMDILADLAPDSLSELKRVLQTREKQEY
ncbi:MAG TPA: type VI secretion system protein TssA [Caulobacteraceae bacterium]|jgi:type VI secretion system protein ImpA|nr:type VI secretion system protein TssA [Caulobacteraceae bacterium]